MRGLESVTPYTGGNDNVKLDELVDMYKFPTNKWIRIRLLPTTMLPIKTHWIKITTKDKNETKIPRICIQFDPDNEAQPKKGVKCPYCTLDHDTGGQAEQGKYYYANAIIRSLEDDKPRRLAKPTKDEIKTGLKDIDSETWTPVRVVRLTNGTVATLVEKGERNTAGKGSKQKAYSLAHGKYGCDIDLRFNPKAPGAKKWSVETNERAPLDADWQLSKENKKGYAIYDLSDDIVEKLGLETQEVAEANFKKMKITGMDKLEDDEDDEDDLPKKKKKKRSSSSDVSLGGKKKKKRSYDDDEDEAPKKKKKRSYDEDDEDDLPKKKKKKRSSDDDEAPKKKKKKRSSDDEDEAPKKKKKKKSVDSDAPKKKKKKKSVDSDAPKKKKKKRAF